MRKLYLICLLMLCAWSTGHTVERFVATGGSNVSCAAATNISTPAQTIAYGQACLAAGDILSIRTGTYAAITYAGASGTSFANAVTIRAYPAEVVTIPFMNISTASYVIFDRLMVNGSGSAQVEGVWIGNSAHHIRIQNGEVKNGLDFGIVISQSGGGFNEFINLDIHHNGGNNRLEHGIYISGAPSNLVNRCRIYNNAAYGVHIYNDNPSFKNDNTIVSNNFIYNNGSPGGTSFGLILTWGNNILAFNNIITGNQAGINIGTTATNAKLYNNTVYNNAAGGYAGIEISSGVTGAIVKNNIAYIPSTINDLGTSTVKSNNITTNPSFVNVGAGDYHLSVGSVAIDAGVAISGFTTDYAGTTWSTPPEAGVFNYGTAVTPNVLVFTNSPTSVILNALIPLVTVCIDDSAGVRQNVTDSIALTIGTDVNPTTTLTGGTGGAATAGCRNFTNVLSLNKTGNGFIIQAVSGAMTKDSNPFNVVTQPTVPTGLTIGRIP